MSRRLAIALVAMVLAAGCGGGDDDATDSATPGSGPARADGAVTIPVSVDALPEDFSASFFAFFPQAVTARPGDTVQFTSRFTGEPHTVAFGTVIDEALTAFEAVAPGQPMPPEVRALLGKAPAFYPPGATNVDADPQPAAAQPCFLASGDPPGQSACISQPEEQPEFNGTQSFYSSGFLPDEATFDVKLAANIAPGTYRFMDLVNRTQMTGTLTVVGPDEAVPSPADVRRQAEEEIEAAIESLRPRAEQVRAITAPESATAGAPEVAAAAAPAGGRQINSTVNVFPERVTVPSGGTVSWAINGAHMIAFNAPEDARPLYAPDAQGVVKANRKGALPANSPPRPRGVPPPVIMDAGPFDGTGFRNSGLVVAEGELTYRLTFTTPGTYQYQCLFHTDMEGSVQVT